MSGSSWQPALGGIACAALGAMLAVLALTSSQTSSATLSLASLDASSRDNSTRLFAPAELERSYRDDGCVAALERSFEAGLKSSWHSFSGWRNAFGAPGDAVRVCASKTSSSQCPPGESLDDLGLRFEHLSWVRSRGAEALRVRPANASSVVVAIHGGGFVSFSAASYYAPRLAGTAARLGAAVYLPEYSLAPKATGADALDEAEAILDLAIEEHPNAKIVLFGDSAGGAVAASLAIRAAKRGVAVALQVLVAPMLAGSDWGRFASYCNRSDHAFASSVVTTPPGLAYVWGARARGREHARFSADFSPFDASDDELAGVAPALIVASTDDVLVDEARLYADRLGARYVEYADLQHDPILRSRPVWEAAMRDALTS